MADAPELTPEVCRQQAIECQRLAASTMSTPHRVMLDHIAQTWLRVVSEIEINDAGVTTRDPT